MKKKILIIFTAILFATGILCSVSRDSSGKISLIAQSKAVENPPLEQAYWATCPDGFSQIVVCAQGFNVCTPYGLCPAN